MGGPKFRFLPVRVRRGGRGKHLSERNLPGERDGQVLLQQFIDSSEENGIWTLQASILKENGTSVALHQKCGFRRVGLRENWVN